MKKILSLSILMAMSGIFFSPQGVRAEPPQIQITDNKRPSLTMSFMVTSGSDCTWTSSNTDFVTVSPETGPATTASFRQDRVQDWFWNYQYKVPWFWITVTCKSGTVPEASCIETYLNYYQGTNGTEYDLTYGNSGANRGAFGPCQRIR